ncbi:U6 snRNA-associated Sm-like protein LSm2 [Cryptococcus gattii E566]|uniref:U6 snRNA-associated sm-like protein lsm2, putative n=2 Tax=Cryptococcus gattii TaxID=37769 RepID=E6R329_CRYGW|nr:u6 snRNA-associated sm-like protein lsm2, putative [Cryptococcus gattii WM276]ADV20883.1 u6 snRNA-associated sm-like protein lsm2, putative [Cryptococcus gattii WM276]KIR82196.1 U6 snRNA-associated Sm-like protein LSm2 [Cryptococcus gattii EJB2]KIY33411.1 U6 snRNA-associated Sm-like protein LSm2 [Cryptococcus gattii E566]KJE00449.1 U6 snRNA-associated Sm-like protein LSm2 [Cryptococcus gattii NT-10]
MVSPYRSRVPIFTCAHPKTAHLLVITVELKNDLSITGTLKSVDQFLNIRLDNISVEDPEKHPHMMAVKNCFIRGSVVRYVRMAARSVDTTLLEDATRREAKEGKK